VIARIDTHELDKRLKITHENRLQLVNLAIKLKPSILDEIVDNRDDVCKLTSVFFLPPPPR